jgi:hypothetical protein
MVARRQQPKKKSSSKAIVGIVAVLVLGAAAWFVFSPGGDGLRQLTAEDLIATLSPDLFAGDLKAQRSYQVAKEIPEVLAQLPCFCGCMLHSGHKSNLFCFKDNHGAACDMCENIALDASEMHKQGLSVARIKETIIQRYSRSGGL